MPMPAQYMSHDRWAHAVTNHLETCWEPQQTAYLPVSIFVRSHLRGMGLVLQSLQAQSSFTAHLFTKCQYYEGIVDHYTHHRMRLPTLYSRPHNYINYLHDTAIPSHVNTSFGKRSLRRKSSTERASDLSKRHSTIYLPKTTQKK